MTHSAVLVAWVVVHAYMHKLNAVVNTAVVVVVIVVLALWWLLLVAYDYECSKRACW